MFFKQFGYLTAVICLQKSPLANSSFQRGQYHVFVLLAKLCVFAEPKSLCLLIVCRFRTYLVP